MRNDTVSVASLIELPMQKEEGVTQELLDRLFDKTRLTFFDTLDPPEEGDWDALGLMSGKWLDTGETAQLSERYCNSRPSLP